MIQRIFDIIISFTAILIVSPLLILIIIILKLTGEGEVFYFQNRVGKNNEEFGLLKFATMVKNSPKIGAGEITIPNDPRVLPFGQFLRKTKINELPQIWNILKGDMSIVGPRPMVPNTYKNYPPEDQKILSTICPGLTGIGSIIFRDEERFLKNQSNPMEFYKENIIPYKSSLEVWYVNNASLSVYIKIILLTAWIIVFSDSKIVDKVFPDLPIKPKFFTTRY